MHVWWPESRLGVEAPKVEVRFERLTVEADVRVGRRAVPTLLNCAVNAAQVTNFFHRRRRTSRSFNNSYAAAAMCAAVSFASFLGFLCAFVSPPSSIGRPGACMHCCKLQASFLLFFLLFQKRSIFLLFLKFPKLGREIIREKRALWIW